MHHKWCVILVGRHFTTTPSAPHFADTDADPCRLFPHGFSWRKQFALLLRTTSRQFLVRRAASFTELRASVAHAAIGVSVKPNTHHKAGSALHLETSCRYVFHNLKPVHFCHLLLSCPTITSTGRRKRLTPSRRPWGRRLRWRWASLHHHSFCASLR